MDARQLAYWKGHSMQERMIPAGLLPDANGEFRWEEMEPCHRCGGAGGSRHWPGFTCFECGGACRLPYPHEAVTRERAEALALAAQKRVERQEARLQKRMAAADALLLPRVGLSWRQLLDIAGWMQDHVGLDILWKLAHGKTKKPAPPTEKQLAVLDRLAEAPARWLEKAAADAARKADEEARLVDLPEGRQPLRGRFVSAKPQHSDFGVTVKGLFVAEVGEGLAKVWMSVPSGFYRWEDGDVRIERDRVLEGKVTIERGQDKGFHYGKRPALKEVV